MGQEYSHKGYMELLEGIAREYVRKADWRTYYKASISFENEQHDDIYTTDSVFLRFTWDDIEYIQRRVVELARDSGHKAATYKDVINEVGTLAELKGRDERIDRLLFGIQVYAIDGCDVNQVDFDNPTYFYDFAVQVYDDEKNLMGNQMQFDVNLSEDEYVFMLYRAMLYSRRGEYTFNRLLNDNPNLACEINKSALSKVTSEKLAGKPFIVLLGDLNREAKDIMAENGEVINDYYSQMNDASGLRRFKVRDK